ncbi:MAG: GNAT family N-acetyltransferase [Actinomycetota bacterium]|nr:GNAT family N-acetyltransferase [Actinomycetota bacterium]
MDWTDNPFAVIYQTTLDDGTTVVMRPIRPEDKPLLLDGFNRLSERSRYFRFFTKLPTLSQDQLHYLTEVDQERHSAWVAGAVGDNQETGVGVVRWIRLDDDPSTAEIAVTVVDAYQRRGLGRTLVYVAAREGLAAGLTSFHAVVLTDNVGTITMLRGMGAGSGTLEDGVLHLEIPLEAVVSRTDLLPLRMEPPGPCPG